MHILCILYVYIYIDTIDTGLLQATVKVIYRKDVISGVNMFTPNSY